MNKPKRSAVADHPRNEEGQDGSIIRMRCSGKSAAAGLHEEQRRIQEGGERLEQLIRRGGRSDDHEGNQSMVGPSGEYLLLEYIYFHM